MFGSIEIYRDIPPFLVPDSQFKLGMLVAGLSAEGAGLKLGIGSSGGEWDAGKGIGGAGREQNRTQ